MTDVTLSYQKCPTANRGLDMKRGMRTCSQYPRDTAAIPVLYAYTVYTDVFRTSYGILPCLAAALCYHPAGTAAGTDPVLLYE